MNIQTQLVEDMKVALKAGDKVRLSTIRMIRAQLKDAGIAKGEDLTSEEVISVLTSATKKRKEAIQAYTDGGRDELAEKERQELEIINSYLPEQLSEEEIENKVVEIIEQVGAIGLKDLGKVMRNAMQEFKGRADGKLVQEMVRKKLV
jgi:uncharacterized protein YqeY